MHTSNRRRHRLRTVDALPAGIGFADTTPRPVPGFADIAPAIGSTRRPPGGNSRHRRRPLRPRRNNQSASVGLLAAAR
jgi:hypothetical protein